MSNEHAGNNNNIRQEIRLDRIQTVFIEVRASYPGDSESCQVMICHSLDVSANGIRARIDHELPINAIYQVCVEFESPPGRLMLAAQVKWLRPSEEEEGFDIGLSIFESDDTDIEQWKLFIAEELSHSE